MQHSLVLAAFVSTNQLCLENRCIGNILCKTNELGYAYSICRDQEYDCYQVCPIFLCEDFLYCLIQDKTKLGGNLGKMIVTYNRSRNRLNAKNQMTRKSSEIRQQLNGKLCSETTQKTQDTDCVFPAYIPYAVF